MIKTYLPYWELMTINSGPDCGNWLPGIFRAIFVVKSHSLKQRNSMFLEFRIRLPLFKHLIIIYYS